MFVSYTTPPAFRIQRLPCLGPPKYALFFIYKKQKAIQLVLRQRQQGDKMDTSNIRVDHTTLQQFNGRVVRIIGKLTSPTTLSTTSITNDRGIIQLNVQQDNLRTKLSNIDEYYEVIGQIQSDLSLKVLDSIPFGTEINELGVANLVKYSNKCKEIYY